MTTEDEALRLIEINRLPTEFWDGRWHWPSNAEPMAVVSRSLRDDDWIWWAVGEADRAPVLGVASTYAAAIEAAGQHMKGTAR